jgi:hypothetical protein
MNHLSRELASISRKILSQLQEIARQLEVKNKSDAKVYEANKRSQVPNHDIIPIPVKIDSLPPIPDDATAYRNEKRSRERHQLLVGRWTLFVLATYTAFTGYQACLTRKAISISEDALASVQRAFVFPGNVRTQTFGDPVNGITSFSLRFSWDNSGTTPAIHVRSHISYEPMTSELPANFSFPDRWPPKGRRVNTPTMIAPRGGIDAIVGPISIDDFRLMKSQNVHLYFWGWARYRDVFSGTPEHLTEMCYELTDFNGDLFSTKPVMLEPILTSCNVHNCYDDECKNQ